MNPPFTARIKCMPNLCHRDRWDLEVPNPSIRRSGSSRLRRAAAEVGPASMKKGSKQLEISDDHS